MPIYEYHCTQCNHNFEYLVMGHSVPDCPACSSKKVKKQMSACGFISKGPGGESTASSTSSSSSCASCSASSCAGCGH